MKKKEDSFKNYFLIMNLKSSKFMYLFFEFLGICFRLKRIIKQNKEKNVQSSHKSGKIKSHAFDV